MEHDGKTWALEDLCYRPASFEPCVIQTPLDYWYDRSTQTYSASLIEADTDMFRTISRSTKTPLGSPIMRDNVISPTGTEDVKPAFLTNFLVRNNDEIQSAAIKWERKMIDVLKPLMTMTNSQFWFTAEVSKLALLISPLNKISITDELGREISADIYVIVASYVVMLIYVAFALGKLHVVHSKFAIGAAGVFTIILAIISAFGLASLFNIMFSPIRFVVFSLSTC